MRLSALFILIIVILAVGIAIYNTQSEPDYMYRPFLYIPEAMQSMVRKGSFGFEVTSSELSNTLDAPVIRLNGWWDKNHGFYVEERQGGYLRDLTAVYCITPDGRMAVMTDGPGLIKGTPKPRSTPNDIWVDVRDGKPVMDGTWEWVDAKTAERKIQYLYELCLGPFEDIKDRIGFAVGYYQTYEPVDQEGENIHSYLVYPTEANKTPSLPGFVPPDMYKYTIYIRAKAKLPTGVGIRYYKDSKGPHSISVCYYDIGLKFEFPRVVGGK